MDKVATSSGFGQALPYLSGFLFVLIVLCLLWLVIELIGSRFRSVGNKKAAALAAKKQQAPVPSPPVENPDQLPPEHLVAITAAVTMMLGKQHRLVSIRKSSADWGREGRRQHLHSHSFR